MCLRGGTLEKPSGEAEEMHVAGSFSEENRLHDVLSLGFELCRIFLRCEIDTCFPIQTIYRGSTNLA